MKVTIKKPDPPPPDVVVLEMSREEAEVLRDLAGAVLGIGHTREITNRVFFALERELGLNVERFEPARIRKEFQ